MLRFSLLVCLTGLRAASRAEAIIHTCKKLKGFVKKDMYSKA
jgi:hypothetical protein